MSGWERGDDRVEACVGNGLTSCLACYHVCPKHAVQYGRRTKRKGQYLNPNVSISHEAAAQ